MGVGVVGLVLSGLLGASIASFLAVVVDRVPRGESLGGRSHCACGEAIRAVDNVPVFGYLTHRGRARCCGARIPRWYLVAEVAGAGLAVAVFFLATA